MRVQVILNPWADRGKALQYKDMIVDLARDYGGLDLVVTDEPGHARRLASAAAEDGYDLVVAAGGDGTVHEIINGLVHGGKALAMLGMIPVGSGNDFAYGMGLLSDLKAAVRRLFTGKPRTIDLARIEDDRGRYVLVDNNVGIGFDAMVVIQSRTITRLHGFAMYTLATLRTIALYYQTPHLKLHFDDESVEQDTLLLAVGVGPRGGGGFFLTPDANHGDDLLDSCTVNPVGRLTMLAMLPRVMRGSHVTSRHVTMRRNKTIRATSSLPLPIHVDGEIFAYPEDDVRQVTITSLPEALSVIT